MNSGTNYGVILGIEQNLFIRDEVIRLVNRLAVFIKMPRGSWIKRIITADQRDVLERHVYG